MLKKEATNFYVILLTPCNQVVQFNHELRDSKMTNDVMYVDRHARCRLSGTKLQYFENYSCN